MSDQYAGVLTMIDFVNAQYNESQVKFSAASEQLAATLSGRLHCCSFILNVFSSSSSSSSSSQTYRVA